jgi:hypothetical protein
MRILIAGFLGAIAMFVWTSIAHMATPLANTGFSHVSDEAPLLAQMQKSIGTKGGLYFFPWIDPKDPKMMEKYAAKMPTTPSGLLLYHPPGASTDMTKPLILEFVKELAESLIAAFLLGWAAIAGFGARTGFVVLIGVAASISTNASYWIWYGFPCSYTLANIAITLIGYLAAGLAIAAVLPKKAMA